MHDVQIEESFTVAGAYPKGQIVVQVLFDWIKE